jgi:hypothetical protein
MLRDVGTEGRHLSERLSVSKELLYLLAKLSQYCPNALCNVVPSRLRGFDVHVNAVIFVLGVYPFYHREKGRRLAGLTGSMEDEIAFLFYKRDNFMVIDAPQWIHHIVIFRYFRPGRVEKSFYNARSHILSLLVTFQLMRRRWMLINISYSFSAFGKRHYAERGFSLLKFQLFFH